MSPGVPVSFRCVTNHPETLRFKAANMYLAHSSVVRLLGLATSGGFAGLNRALLTSAGLAHAIVVS